MSWQRVRIEIPEGFKPADREALGARILEYIRERTAQGVGVKGNRTYDFPEYTEDYAKFKGQRRVDLLLSGAMLEEMKVLSTNPTSIVIGFDRDSDLNGRAEGNILGSYGGAPNPKRARNFLGLTKSELKDILPEFE